MCRACIDWSAQCSCRADAEVVSSTKARDESAERRFPHLLVPPSLSTAVHGWELRAYVQVYAAQCNARDSERASLRRRAHRSVARWAGSLRRVSPLRWTSTPHVADCSWYDSQEGEGPEARGWTTVPHLPPAHLHRRSPPPPLVHLPPAIPGPPDRVLDGFPQVERQDHAPPAADWSSCCQREWSWGWVEGGR
jgi:hypothetical protein